MSMGKDTSKSARTFSVGSNRDGVGPVGARALTSANPGEYRIVQILDGRP